MVDISLGREGLGKKIVSILRLFYILDIVDRLVEMHMRPARVKEKKNHISRYGSYSRGRHTKIIKFSLINYIFYSKTPICCPLGKRITKRTHNEKK